MILTSLYENDFLVTLNNIIYLKIKNNIQNNSLKYEVGILNGFYLILSCTHIF